MKVLFDQGTPVPLRNHLEGHEIDTAFELGWSSLRNGELLEAGEQGAYQVLISTDQSIRYQQNLSGRTMAIVVLLSTSWPNIQKRVRDIQAVVDMAAPGTYTEVTI
jgi:hypothetical protein